MIKLDYDKIPEKLKELEKIAEELRLQVDDRCSEIKKEVLACAAEQEVFFNYQRSAMEYFEELEKLKIVEQQIKTLEEVPGKLLEAKELSISNLQILENQLKEKAPKAFNISKPYLDRAAQKAMEVYKECQQSTAVWEEKQECKLAAQLIQINTLMKSGYKLWNESKSIATMKTMATQLFICVSKCMKIVYNEKERYLVNFKAEHSKDLMQVEASIAQLQILLEMREQCKVIPYFEPLIQEELLQS